MPRMSSFSPNTLRSNTWKAVACFLCVLLYNYLLYRQNGWGINISVFSLILLIICLFFHQNASKTWIGKVVFIATALLLPALAWEFSMLKVLLFLGGLMALVQLDEMPSLKAKAYLAFLSHFLNSAIPRFMKDGAALLSSAKKANIIRVKMPFKHIALPLIFSTLFLYFFAQANPYIHSFFDNWHFSFRWLSHIASWLIAYKGLLGSLIVMVFVWGMLHIRPEKEMSSSEALMKDLGAWLSRNSIIFSLFVFNLIFAVQNVSDILFLWTSTSDLPQGISYAHYARAGAYPLIITVLLAATYVLLIYGQNQTKYQSSSARALTYLWLIQNAFLCVSAIDRNLNYIAFYSLTYLRLFALIWMGLIIVGLCLIVFRIQRLKSNAWLINANILIVLIVLYLSCFINYAQIIAEYNTNRAIKANETTAPIDFNYICDLGIDAAKPLLKLHDRIQSSDDKTAITACLEKLNYEFQAKRSLRIDWRSQEVKDRYLNAEIGKDLSRFKNQLESTSPEPLIEEFRRYQHFNE